MERYRVSERKSSDNRYDKGSAGISTRKDRERIRRTYHSYDYILEEQIGRPSRNTSLKLRIMQHRGILLTVLVVTLFLISITLFIGNEPVEASDGTERVKDYICVEIEEGDTLWSIAGEYMTDEFSSWETFVEETENINGMDKDTVLKPGNRIMVPCYKTVSNF